MMPQSLSSRSRGTENTGWFSERCPNCGKSDWCRQHEGGSYLCRRGPGPGLVERLDKWRVPYWISPPQGTQSADLAPSVPDSERLSSKELDAAYKSLLSHIGLTDSHRSSLEKRGMSDTVIERHCFRSWPSRLQSRRELAASLYDEFGEFCRSVPGWYELDGRSMLAGGSGIAIPMFGIDGDVVAIRIRSDCPKADHKYYWLSSGGDKGGASSGVHARLAWPGRRPRRDERADVVRVTEGEFKSIVLAEATGVPTISVPGVTLWALALPWLRWLRAHKLLLCYDSDVTTNRDVARGFLSARAGYIKHNFEVVVETWKERVGA